MNSEKDLKTWETPMDPMQIGIEICTTKGKVTFHQYFQASNKQNKTKKKEVFLTGNLLRGALI